MLAVVAAILEAWLCTFCCGVIAHFFSNCCSVHSASTKNGLIFIQLSKVLRRGAFVSSFFNDSLHIIAVL